MKPFIVLWHIPSVAQNIVGDEDGQLGMIADDMLQYCIDLHSKILRRETTTMGIDCRVPFCDTLMMPSWKEDVSPIAGNYEMENIPIQKYIIEDRWLVRCGFGPRSKMWVIRSTKPIDLRTLDIET